MTILAVALVAYPSWSVRWALDTAAGVDAEALVAHATAACTPPPPGEHPDSFTAELAHFRWSTAAATVQRDGEPRDVHAVVPTTLQHQLDLPVERYTPWLVAQPCGAHLFVACVVAVPSPDYVGTAAVADLPISPVTDAVIFVARSATFLAETCLPDALVDKTPAETPVDPAGPPVDPTKTVDYDLHVAPHIVTFATFVHTSLSCFGDARGLFITEPR